jgi:hypothetical protein
LQPSLDPSTPQSKAVERIEGDEDEDMEDERGRRED